MSKNLKTVDGETLMTAPLPPIRFIINGLLPQGLHILAGAPKVGKSWLALWLCLRIAILLIHHLRKMNDDDPMNASSRTAYRSLPCRHESSLTLSLLLFRSNPLRWALPRAPENSTTGISGATDSNFVLRKDKRGGSTATLYCTGRDIEYRELTLEFDTETHI